MQDPVYVRDAFAEIAPKYVSTNHVLCLGIDVLWRRKVASMVAKGKPSRILDLATGTGDLALELGKKLPASMVVAADFCEPMLEVARERGVPNTTVADGMNLPFEDEGFDAVTIGFGLRNMEDWAGGVREMARVIRPGGKLFVLDFSMPKNPLLRGAYRFYLHHVLNRVAGWLTGARHAYDYLGGTIEKFPSGDAMCELLVSNGFKEAKSRPLSFGISSIYEATK
ncbi:MAG: ubiquinone/menaquinone biosynthesis methyltransferase [Verrucomicrobiota bacterium]